MNELVQADIFFFITSIAVILVAGLFATLLVYLIKVLRDAKDISHRIKQEMVAIADDLTDLRANLREHGTKLSSLADIIKDLSAKKTSRPRNKKIK